ncbi:MAG: AraC family transcriptional regulator [Nocardia sp.]|nr:AraC family transcriptional regulator [Nocardia sp.]
MDHILLPKYVLDSVGLAPAQRWRLARESGLEDWMLSSSDAMVSSDSQLRLWELAEHALEDPCVALRAAAFYTPGKFGLHDYLLATAPTLREGLAACKPFMDTITTNFDFEVAAAKEAEMSLDIRLHDGVGRARELAMQFAVVTNVVRARRLTTRQVTPVRVGFRQRAPRRHDRLVELLGTTRVDFDMPTDRVTFRVADLSSRLKTADPILAAILGRYAETVPLSRPVVTTWSARLHDVLRSMLGEEHVTVEAVARRLATSKRSLQRRLTEEGTTWSAELDRARRARWERVQRSHSPAGFDTARQVGYADTRALRRARQRWSGDC